MKNTLLIVFGLVISFTLGYAFNTLISNAQTFDKGIKRVTSIGGIFFKCKDPKKVREWYNVHLGLKTNQYGSVFEWRRATDSTQKGFTQWSPFKESTKYFEPSTKEFMINFRVHDLPTLIAELKKEGVTVLDTIETFEYGKFAHILDNESNKIELWEPNDVAYEKMGLDMGLETTK